MEEFNIDLRFIVYICSAIASISGAIGIIIKVVKKSLNKQISETIEASSSGYKQNMDTEMKELKTTLQNFIQSQQSQNESVRRCLLSSTRDRINQAHDYYTKSEFIGAHSLFVVEELYSSYKELGGNSFVDRQIEDIRQLEVRSAETDARK